MQHLQKRKAEGGGFGGKEEKLLWKHIYERVLFYDSPLSAQDTPTRTHTCTLAALDRQRMGGGWLGGWVNGRWVVNLLHRMDRQTDRRRMFIIFIFRKYNDRYLFLKMFNFFKSYWLEVGETWHNEFHLFNIKNTQNQKLIRNYHAAAGYPNRKNITHTSCVTLARTA